MATQTVFTEDSFSPYLYCQATSTYIYFPAMPESYEISRDVDWIINTGRGNNALYPDGFSAVYAGGDPIHIPISFVVHSNDPQCVQGPYTLVQAAKALHSMALPWVPDSAYQSLGASPTLASSSSESNLAAGASGTDTSASGGGGSQQIFYQPPAVQLVMFQSGVDGTATYVDAGTGVCMNGFLKNVKAKAQGPWLKAQGFVGRLPSSMEFSFTFVFFPSYTPTPTSPGVSATTTGSRVAQYFFGTNAVVSSTGGTAGTSSISTSSALTPAATATSTPLSSSPATTLPLTTPSQSDGSAPYVTLPITVIPGSQTTGNIVPQG